MRNEEILKLKVQYGDLFRTEICERIYIWRKLTKAEYQMIDETDTSDEEKEDMVCQVCLLYPKYIDYNKGPGGIPTALTSEILIYSGFNDEHATNILEYHRLEMGNLEAQMEAIIKEAFPTLTLEEIESWNIPKTLKYYSRAEWILEALRGIPVRQILEQVNQPQDGLVSGDKSDFPEFA